MSRETNIRDRMVQVAQSLLHKTLEGRAQWSTTDQEDAYLFSGSRSSVKIEFYEDREDGETYRMSLLNQRGTLVEDLKTEWQSTIDPDGDPAFHPAAWNDILERLYDAARREALDIDDLLDSVLDDLKKDPPPKAKKDDGWPQPARPHLPRPKLRRPTSSFDDEPPF